MQLFVLDWDAKAAAEMLCDVHLRKMCLETAQILSGVIFLQGKKPTAGMPGLYNVKHPVIRSIDTPEKINWVILCNEALHRNYLKRFGKVHAYSLLAPEYRKILFTDDVSISKESLTFARNFKDIEITEPDLVLAYRIYYRCKKHILKNWHYTNSSEPDWLREEK